MVTHQHERQVTPWHVGGPTGGRVTSSYDVAPLLYKYNHLSIRYSFIIHLKYIFLIRQTDLTVGVQVRKQVPSHRFRSEKEHQLERLLTGRPVLIRYKWEVTCKGSFIDGYKWEVCVFIQELSLTIEKRKKQCLRLHLSEFISNSISTSMHFTVLPIEIY